MTPRAKWCLIFMVSGVLLLLGVAASQLPSIGAALILHPVHRPVVAAPPPGCRDVIFNGEGVSLHGWRGDAMGQRRGTLIYLHGVADNRASSTGVIERFRKRGFDVVAYDGRAHGASGGGACTYGYYEKEDLRRVMDTLAPGPIVLVGGSLGAAVALQAAAGDRRVTGVVAAEVFSDLKTVVTERAPAFFTDSAVGRAIQLAEQQAKFQVDAVSPALAARSITAPVLLIHGAEDKETPPEHSRRVLAGLAGAKHLILVPGAGHCQSLQGGEIWEEIERWVDTVVP